MPVTDIGALLETSAAVTTVLQYLSGALVCRKYILKKSTGDSCGFPFICGFLSCSFWLNYGLFTKVQSIVLVNIIGTTLFFIYSVIYYVFTVNKKSYLKQFALIFTILLGVIYYTNNLDDVTGAIRIMGIICCVVTVCFFAAPLTMLLHVVRIRNSESLPFPLIAMTFLVSIQWLIFGIIISDLFIQVAYYNRLFALQSAITKIRVFLDSKFSWLPVVHVAALFICIVSTEKLHWTRLQIGGRSVCNILTLLEEKSN